MSKILSALAIAMFAFSLTPTSGSAGELDGTQWKMRPEGWRAILLFWQTDTLKFHAGEFESIGCIPSGFLHSPYESRKSGDKVV